MSILEYKGVKLNTDVNSVEFEDNVYHLGYNEWIQHLDEDEDEDGIARAFYVSRKDLKGGFKYVDVINCDAEYHSTVNDKDVRVGYIETKEQAIKAFKKFIDNKES